MTKLNFSTELLEDVKITDAIGKNIICEDGIERRCVEIVGSMKWPWKVIINEHDPDSKMGHFVNMLSLCAQILGKPIPDKDAQKAFEKIMRVSFGIQEDGTFNEPPPKKKLSLGFRNPFKK